MATMKENKGKEVVDKTAFPKAQSQPHLSIRDKRKNLSKMLDLGNLPSRQGHKKAKHGSSRPEVIKPSTVPRTSQAPPFQVLDVDVPYLTGVTPSKTTTLASFQPRPKVPMNTIENEDIAWERFENYVTEEDMVAYYDSSLKEFEHSVVQDLFKFIAASRQAAKIDKVKAKLETKLRQVKDDCRGWAEVASKAKNEAKEFKNLVEELKANVVENDTRLDHFQKRNDVLSNLLKDAKKIVVEDFRASSQFTDLLDMNYVASYEDFPMDAIECLPKVDFSPIKLQLRGTANSLLQMSFEDVNVEDDASTQPA